MSLCFMVIEKISLEKNAFLVSMSNASCCIHFYLYPVLLEIHQIYKYIKVKVCLAHTF